MTNRMDIAIDLGTTRRVTLDVATFDDVALPIDPADLVLLVRSPSGLVHEPSVQRDERGSYFAELVVDEPGQWFHRWETAGPVRADEGSFLVRRSPFETSTPDPSDNLTWAEFELLTDTAWNALTYSSFGEAPATNDIFSSLNYEQWGSTTNNQFGVSA